MIPNDPYFGEQWGMLNTGQTIVGEAGKPGGDIGAPGAWNLWTGDPDYRIAVLDTGIDWSHPDLAANVWTNPGEIPDNGIDDDGNGWIDDVHGYDMVNGDGDPIDDYGHGTHVSGIIGAVGNNGIGVAGVNWHCKLVALKVLDEYGNGYISAAVEAMDYVIANNIHVANASWGGEIPFPTALYDAIATAQGIGHLFFAAAGNLLGRDIDRFPVYPAALDLDNVIAVAGTNNLDVLSYASNTGAVSVDLGAPGFDVLSTVHGGLSYLSGTSMATPHVSGTAALLWSRRPELSWQEVRARLLETVRPLDSLAGRTVTGGMLNAAWAVGDCNGNGVADEVEIAAGSSADCDGNGLPDECQADCNGNAIADECDLDGGASADCNGNDIPDECDLADGAEVDCNGNTVPDSCDLLSGASSDANDTGIPDECEMCAVAGDCDDGNPCTDQSCEEQLCQASFNNTACDDGDECTFGDTCSGGGCYGFRVPGEACDPIVSLRVAQVNGHPVPGGPASAITVARGDRLTVEFYLERWTPEHILSYNLTLDAEGYRSGTTGSLAPLVDLDPSAGAFIEQLRPDFLFNDLATITLLSLHSEYYLYGSIVLFLGDCIEPGDGPAYLGTLLLDVTPQASGAFTLCFHPADTSTFLLECPTGVHMRPPLIECVEIDVPLEETDCAGGPDCNGNGRWDICDVADGTSPDCNANDVPDECDIASEFSPDCNGNQAPDECDLAGGSSFDCNRNEQLDECDLSAGISNDCNENAMPDECETGWDQDCNQNGVADLCDIHVETSKDCNDNGAPDECDLAAGPSTDCNRNASPDECDIAAGASGDCDANGIPDECEPDCNGSGLADECDILTGQSDDCEPNGIPDECSGLFPGGLIGQYFNNTGFTGPPFTRVDPTIDFDWGFGAPAPDVRPSGFAVRWTGWVVPTSTETYTFLTRTNDGVRLWVDGVLIIDEWIVQTATEWSGTIQLQGNTAYPLVMEYFDSNDEAIAQLRWATPTKERDIVPFSQLVYYVPDCNDNGAPDACDVAAGEASDCNANGVLDSCDVANETSLDCNFNHVPDECERAMARDACADLQPICPGPVYVGSTVDMAADGAADCGNSDESPDVYYVYTPIADGTLIASLCGGTDYDSVISIHLECPATGESEVGDGCNDDGCGGFSAPSEVSIPVTAGTDYVIRVAGWRDSAGRYILHLEGPDCASGGDDCDGDGETDLCEITSGADSDCNQNQIPDSCDISDSTSEDCQPDAVPDECQLDENDCNQNAVPDDCEPNEDCNQNFVQDICDIAAGFSGDCDGNLVPDDCQSDSDEDGFIDACDICGDSDLGGTIVIEGCETAVGNQLLANGCTMADVLAGCPASGQSHYAHLDCIERQAIKWRRAGLLSAVESNRLILCAQEFAPFPYPYRR